MNVTITAKIRLFPTSEQARQLDACASAFARTASYVARAEACSKDRIKAQKIQDRHYQEIRDMFGLKSQQTCSVCKTVAAAYTSIQSNKHNRSKTPEFKHAFFEAVRGRDYTLKDGKASLNTLEAQRVKIPYKAAPQHAELIKQGKLGTAKVFKRHNKHYMHIPVAIEVEEPTRYREGETIIVGIDRGIRFLMTCYDSLGRTTFFDGKEVLERRKQYKAKRSELQKKGTPSARRRLKAMGSRENRWMSDVNHCLSKALVETYPAGTIFVLEDLSGIRGSLVKAKRNERYERVSWAYADFEAKLRYKAQRAGQRVVLVNPAFSSQECPKCGHVARENRNKRRHVFECVKCRYTSNDDRTAAMVLMKRGKEKVLAELEEQASS